LVAATVIIGLWAPTAPAGEPTMVGESTTTKSGLKYETLKKGRGAGAKRDQEVTIHETVTLEDGTKVFSTRDSGRPVTFTLGGGMVIAGLEEGVEGMRVGERRKLTIPPKLSKRKSYPENVPPEATLISEVDLIEIR
jgi:FKBP-type peptidyl-prolyl cis-trans isomerase